MNQDEELSDNDIAKLIRGKTIKLCYPVDSEGSNGWYFIFTDGSTLQLDWIRDPEYTEGKPVDEGAHDQDRTS